jgi:hypothetical protein
MLCSLQGPWLALGLSIFDVQAIPGVDLSILYSGSPVEVSFAWINPGG